MTTKFSVGDKVYYTGRTPLPVGTDSELILNPDLSKNVGTVHGEDDQGFVQFWLHGVLLEVHRDDLAFATPPSEPQLAPVRSVEVLIRVHRGLAYEVADTDANTSFSISPPVYVSHSRLRSLMHHSIDRLLDALDYAERTGEYLVPTLGEVDHDHALQAGQEGPQAQAPPGSSPAGS